MLLPIGVLSNLQLPLWLNVFAINNVLNSSYFNILLSLTDSISFSYLTKMSISGSKIFDIVSGGKHAHFIFYSACMLSCTRN